MASTKPKKAHKPWHKPASTSRASTNPDRKAPKGVANPRTKNTMKRLNMYRSRPTRNVDGKILHQEFQSKELPNARIQPDRRWFGNTRSATVEQIEKFRTDLKAAQSNPHQVIMKQNTIPMSLLTDTYKQKRMHILEVESFSSTFGNKSTRKRPKLTLSAPVPESSTTTTTTTLTTLLPAKPESDENFTSNEESNYELLTTLAATSQKKYDPQADQRTNAASQLSAENPNDTPSLSLFDKGQSKRIYSELYKVIDSSDVVIHVLDSRDPLGTLCPHLMKHLKRNHPHKHIILILNKCDLIPISVTSRWVAHLSNQYPTLAFHSSITNSFGKSSLIQLLRQFAKLHSDKPQITVGFVGYPNVGKSSVINTLSGKKVCKVAPVPGETKVWQYITLMKRIYLIDCPGVVEGSKKDQEGDKIRKGVVRVERIEGTVEYVGELMARVDRKIWEKVYGIKGWKNAEEFCELIGKKSGRLNKGGEVDMEGVGKMVLRDWQRGKIPWFVPAPKKEGGEKEEGKEEVKDEVKEEGGVKQNLKNISVRQEYKEEEDEMEREIKQEKEEDEEEEEGDERVNWEDVMQGVDDDDDSRGVKRKRPADDDQGKEDEEEDEVEEVKEEEVEEVEANEEEAEVIEDEEEEGQEEEEVVEQDGEEEEQNREEEERNKRIEERKKAIQHEKEERRASLGAEYGKEKKKRDMGIKKKRKRIEEPKAAVVEKEKRARGGKKKVGVHFYEYANVKNKRARTQPNTN
eukprot:TRINITY_DN977_c0_g1_i1.p1 TRINITY_DN977_c0_g1~~TRINITY_DN977_c0_g1_i1.p1  ORF type:complete len:745 (+),score=337.20 TRINITY_DN977_c0_g1_i1:99-2333(+)